MSSNERRLQPVSIFGSLHMLDMSLQRVVAAYNNLQEKRFAYYEAASSINKPCNIRHVVLDGGYIASVADIGNLSKSRRYTDRQIVEQSMVALGDASRSMMKEKSEREREAMYDLYYAEAVLLLETACSTELERMRAKYVLMVSNIGLHKEFMFAQELVDFIRTLNRSHRFEVKVVILR